MDLLVVAGNINEMFYTKISYKKNIINKKETYTSELFDIIQTTHIRFDAIMIMDEGINQSLEEFEDMIRKMKPSLQNKQIIYITRDLELRELFKEDQVYFQDRVRISWMDYEEIFKQVINKVGPVKKVSWEIREIEDKKQDKNQLGKNIEKTRKLALKLKLKLRKKRYPC